MIYFHGNAEDLGKTLPFLQMIQSKFSVHIVAVEYPGYGVYDGAPSERAVFQDADRVQDFVRKALRRQPRHIVAMGRSIGTGPACYLASKWGVGALVLISPYTSIRKVVKHMFGALSQYIIKERFKNFEMIEDVICPTFILHGEKDTVIPMDHSTNLSML